MSGKNKILYTIAKYDPREVTGDENKIADVHEHYKLLELLSKDGANRYDNVLLGMVRDLIQYSEDKSKRIKMDRIIANAFIGVEFEDIKDTDTLYLVEMVLVGDEIHYEPLNVWTADVRVFKAVLMRKLAHASMKNDDLMMIVSKYGLDQYYHSVKIGGVDDSDKISFVNMYNHYLYEFYKRSNDPDQKVQDDYLEKASSPNMLASFRNQDSYAKIVFSHELSLRGTLEQSVENIKEFYENIKHYTKRMYELNYGEDFCKANSGQGNSNYKKKFELYDRYLIIYDLFKDIVGPDLSIDDRKLNKTIDHIGKYKVVDKCKDMADKDHLSLRKEIRKCIKLLRSLSYNPLKVISPDRTNSSNIPTLAIQMPAF